MRGATAFDARKMALEAFQVFDPPASENRWMTLSDKDVSVHSHEIVHRKMKPHITSLLSKKLA